MILLNLRSVIDCRLLCVFLLLAPLRLAPSSTGSLCVWALGSLERVRPKDPPITHPDISLWAARGEYESFQVVVHAKGGPLQNVRVFTSNLTSEDGHIISADDLILYREHYVRIPVASASEGTLNRSLGPGWYPDALIPFIDPATGREPAAAELRAVPFSVESDHNQPIWVDIRVPRDAKPGVYTGYVTITTHTVTQIPIKLTVWNFVLPVKPSLRSALSIYRPLLDDHATYELLLRHRLMPHVVSPSTTPALTETLGLNTTGLRIWSNAHAKTCRIGPAPSRSEIERIASRYTSNLDLYVYVADEINRCPNLFPALKEWARNIRAAGVKVLLVAAPVKDLQDDGTGRSVADIWVLLPKVFDIVPDEIEDVRRRGDEIWSYTALAQDSFSPKWLVDFSPINFRIHPGFLSQGLGLKGILYWSVNYWTADPWNDIQYVEDGYPFAGEGMLIYPGQKVGIMGAVPSMRLKWLRDGVEDYEYIEILKRYRSRSEVASFTNRIARNWHEWTKDRVTLENVRREIGALLNRIVHNEHSSEIPSDPLNSL